MCLFLKTNNVLFSKTIKCITFKFKGYSILSTKNKLCSIQIRRKVLLLNTKTVLFLNMKNVLVSNANIDLFLNTKDVLLSNTKSALF